MRNEFSIDDDVKKFLGLPPYDEKHSFGYQNHIFAERCEERYGKEAWTDAVLFHIGG